MFKTIDCWFGALEHVLNDLPKPVRVIHIEFKDVPDISRGGITRTSVYALVEVGEKF